VLDNGSVVWLSPSWSDCSHSPASCAPKTAGRPTPPRFGTIADYPADLFSVQDPPPDNGDGASFRTADSRAQLAIFGAYNVENDTPQSCVATLDEFKDATYKRVTPEFYAISGASGADIYYDRCNFPPHNDDVLNCIHVTYPAREKAFWDAIVTRISKSLRSGSHG
jgi:hypothetical protein